MASTLRIGVWYRAWQCIAAVIIIIIISIIVIFIVIISIVIISIIVDVAILLLLLVLLQLLHARQCQWICLKVHAIESEMPSLAQLWWRGHIQGQRLVDQAQRSVIATDRRCRCCRLLCILVILVLLTSIHTLRREAYLD